MKDPDHFIVLFDGVCNFCNGTVNLIIDQDPHQCFRFASLQSEAGQRLLEQFHLPTHELNTLVLIEGNKHYTQSTAALRIIKHLRSSWRFLYAFILVPTCIRDSVYKVIAQNRYRWFGKSESCRIPTPELKERFL